MKKALAVLMVLCMLLTAMAVAEAADFAGTWYCVELAVGEMTISPADLGMSVALTLNEDGTGALDSGDGDVTEGTWVVEGNAIVFTSDDVPVTFTMVDGNLYAEDEESETAMTFSREAAESFVPGEPVVAEVEAFEGTWDASKIEMYGMFVDPAMMEMEVSVIIHGTTLSLIGFGDDSALSDLGMTYADGVMSITKSDDEGNTFAISAQMLEDGMMAMTIEVGEGDSITLYMLPIEATE